MKIQQSLLLPGGLPVYHQADKSLSSAEKINELTGQVNGFVSGINRQAANLSVDATGIMEGLQGLYAQQVQRIVNFTQNYESNKRNNTVWGNFARDAAYQSLQGAREGLDIIFQEMARWSGGTSRAAAGSGAGWNGNIVIHATQTERDDWAKLVRDKIIPELRSAGVIN